MAMFRVQPMVQPMMVQLPCVKASCGTVAKETVVHNQYDTVGVLYAHEEQQEEYKFVGQEQIEIQHITILQISDQLPIIASLIDIYVQFCFT